MTPSQSHSASKALPIIAIILQRQSNILFSFFNVFSFQLFTKVEGKNHFCPCSRNCQETTHAKNPISEWNGKNVKKMTRGNRVVYILCLCKVQLFSPVFSNTFAPASVTADCFVSLSLLLPPCFRLFCFSKPVIILLT